MNLNHIIDVILDYLYNDPGKGQSVSKILTERQIPFNYENSKIICEKVDQLDYFDIMHYASIYGYDSGLDRNVKGFEFYQKYKSYTNYLATLKKEEDRIKRLNEKGSRGSYWSGIGAIIAIPLSIASIGFSVYTYRQSTQQTKAIEATTLSLKNIKKEVKSISKSNYRPPQHPAKKDSLVNSKRR